MDGAYEDSIYRGSLALLTDLYQLTMACAYWKSGLAEREAVFHMTFRRAPFGGGYAIAAGLAAVIEHLERFRFDPDDLAYLVGLKGADGGALLDPGFLEYLGAVRFTCDVDALPEGTAVFPHEPLVRVRGPVLQGQLLETPLLTLLNFQTLIATKAARVVGAAGADPVLEFGMRRAQGIDGALSASRAAYLGGCSATSNALAGKRFGIPLGGTHAHSWVMAFDDEREAFAAFARALPNNAVFLVDTYDSLEGVRRACKVGKWLREDGHRLLGVRLDSGDLAYLSREARRILDAEGFADAAFYASNDLDETLIASLKEQGARIGVWGVGTQLVTAFDQPALGGVYKLSAIRGADGEWKPRVKLSEQVAKISDPGILQVRRFFDSDGAFAHDMIFDQTAGGEPASDVIIDPLDFTRRRRVDPVAKHEDLLEPVFRGGAFVGPRPTLEQSRDRAKRQLASLHSGIRRLANAHRYPVGLERSLHQLKTDLVFRARGYPDDVR